MASPPLLRESISNGFDIDLSPRHKKRSSKIFCDPVHGQITLHPVCVAIVDTPQFQRLRHIRQTGFTEYVYPGSSHNRFGHSLGVCHLANQFLQQLKEQQPELKLSDTDILCVEVAGLCHDLGHGPFSHTWENFMKTSSKKNNCRTPWKHERVSANMLDYLIEENDLFPILEEHGIGYDELEKIKEYILGVPIINNDDSGLDVDKFDYFLRDCLHLGLPCSFEYKRLMQYAKVYFVDGRAQICFRDKTLESVYNVFRTRSNLHRLAYQHKMILLIEQMFLDALEMVDNIIVGLNGEVLNLWGWSMAAAFAEGKELKRALDKFCMLTDDFVYNCVKLTPIKQLQKASNLLKAIDRRSCKDNGFYRHIGFRICSEYCNEEEILQGICQFIPEAYSHIISTEGAMDCGNLQPVTQADICILVVPVNWGKGSRNPVDSVYFYSKDDTYMRKGSEVGVSSMPPIAFQEMQVHVICRRSDDFAFKVVRFCHNIFWECQESR